MNLFYTFNRSCQEIFSKGKIWRI